MTVPKFEVRPAIRTEDLAAVRALFEEYVSSLGVDLCFQGFSQELASLPGAYAPPDGRLYLARVAADPAGCIALRRLDGTTGEVKRLYVRPAFRGLGLGRSLVARIVEEARAIGFRRLLLDTLSGMEHARRVYRQIGFREVPAYYDNPFEGAVYMELLLGPEDPRGYGREEAPGG